MWFRKLYHFTTEVHDLFFQKLVEISTYKYFTSKMTFCDEHIEMHLTFIEQEFKWYQEIRIYNLSNNYSKWYSDWQTIIFYDRVYQICRDWIRSHKFWYEKKKLQWHGYSKIDLTSSLLICSNVAPHFLK